MVLILPWYMVDGSQKKLSGELVVGAHTGLALESLQATELNTEGDLHGHGGSPKIHRL